MGDLYSYSRVHEVVLETEFDNFAALSLYESLGFMREKRLYRFYLNGKDAYRLVLTIPSTPSSEDDGSDASDYTNALKRRGPIPLHTRVVGISPYSSDEEDSSR